MRVSTPSFLYLVGLVGASSTASAFQPAPLFGTRRIASKSTASTSTTCSTSLASSTAEDSTGIETGVIKGIREDDAEIDFGRCGVKLSEETAVRMTGTIDRKKMMAQWKTLDNFLEVQTVDDETAATNIVATAVGIENYKDPGTTTVKTVVYGPDEAAKAIVAKAASVMGKDTIVVNVLGGDDLQVSEVLDAVQTITKGLDVQTDANVVWNSLSFKDFADGQATIVVVAMDKGVELSMLDKQQDEESVTGEDDDKSSSPSSSGLSGVERSLAMGEIYMDNDGKYLTVIEEDVVVDFTEDWMV
jgi:hypothetical protein